MTYVKFWNTECCVGTQIVALPSIEGEGSPLRGKIVAGEIMFIQILQKTNEGLHIGIFSKAPKFGWHNLDGEVDNGHGWYITENEAERYFSPRTGIEIRGDFEFKGQNLKGLKGRLLAKIDNTNFYLVELRKNVKGSSGDGLGKKGCCVMIDKKLTKQI